MDLTLHTHEALYRQVLNICVGRHIGETLCMCCECSIITVLTFECGYIVSPSNGGSLDTNNILPLCTHCYRCMGSMDMVEFMKENCLPGIKLFNGQQQYRHVGDSTPSIVGQNDGIETTDLEHEMKNGEDTES